MAEPFDDPFDDQPLVRSLREPGTPGELGDQDRYLAMFRETRGDGKVTHLGPGPRRPGGRTARRLGVGTTLSIAFAVAGGGVAAAYTANLPEPLQQFAHEVLGPVNVPAPVERRPDRVTAAPEPDPSPSARQTPDATPSAPEPTAQPEVSKPGDDRDPSVQASATSEPSESASEEPDPTSPATSTPTPTPTPTPTSTPTSTPTPTPSPTATATSTPTPVVPTAASLTIAGTTHRVEYAAAPMFSGVVLDDEELGVPDVEVALLQRQEGAWRRVAFAMTDEDGAVTMSAPPIYENTAMRLKTQGAKSQRWRVSMHPELRLSPTVDADTVTIVATAVGGHEGDVVRLTGPRDGQRVTLALGLLGPDGTVTFQVEQQTRKARYGALIEATDEHTADKGSVVVVKPKPPPDDDVDGDGEGDPSPSP